MREIKFRAWNTSKEVMHSAKEMGADQEALLPDGRGFANISSAHTSLSQIHSHLIPLQYTGLKDKKGVEIYEGDIVKGFKDTGYFPVKWSKESASFIAVNNHTFVDASVWKHREVIGNIYENKELL